MAVLAALCMSLALPAPAQEEDAPVPLAPAVPPPPDPALPAPAGEAAAPESEPEGIEVDVLEEIGPDNVGVLGAEVGGFGADMWQGTSRALVERLLPTLAAPVASRAQRDLMRRLILSEAAAPGGPAGVSLLDLRLERAWALGNAADVEALLARVPERHLDAEKVRRKIDLAWLAGDLDRGCAATRQYVGRFGQDVYLQKALILCQARAGQRAEASLGLGLLGELGQDDDAQFVELAGALAAGEKPASERPSALTPLHLALLDALGEAVPASVLREADPHLLAAIAGRDKADPAVRLEAAERAFTLGALSIESLQRRYIEEAASDKELARAAESVEATPHGRAVLYQAAAGALKMDTRARLIAGAFADARRRGTYAETAALYASLLLQVVPAPDLGWFAGEAARALYLIGRYETAAAWLEVAQASSDPKAALATPALWFLARLSGGTDPVVLDGGTLAGGEAGAGDEAGAAAVRLVAILEAFQEKPGDVWAALGEEAKLDAGGLPSAAVWFGLGGAAAEGRVGETVLLALAALGPQGPGAGNPMVLARVLRALRQVGLEEAARAIAYEVAIGGGL